MTSLTTAIRTQGSRCVHCNQRCVEAWLCSDCSFSSLLNGARFYVDARSASPTSVGRRGMYFRQTDGYPEVAVMPALTTAERFAKFRGRMRSLEADKGRPLTLEERLDVLENSKEEAELYSSISQRVNRIDERLRRERCHECSNTVAPLNPHRWCDECQCARVHRAGCKVRAHDGPYVGGYDDDGLQRAPQTKFGALKQPNAWWTSANHTQHRRAVRLRWDAFLLQWSKIGLECLTRVALEQRMPHAFKTRKPRRRRALLPSLVSTEKDAP